MIISNVNMDFFSLLFGFLSHVDYIPITPCSVNEEKPIKAQLCTFVCSAGVSGRYAQAHYSVVILLQHCWIYLIKMGKYQFWLLVPVSSGWFPVI